MNIYLINSEYPEPNKVEQTANIFKRFSPTVTKIMVAAGSIFSALLLLGVGIGVGIGVAALISTFAFTPLMLGGTFGFVVSVLITATAVGISWGYFKEVIQETKDNGYARKILSAEQHKITAAKLHAIQLYSKHIRTLDFREIHCQDEKKKEKLLERAEHANHIDFGLERNQAYLAILKQRCLKEFSLTLNNKEKDLEFLQELIKACPEVQKVTLRNCSTEALSELLPLQELKKVVIDEGNILTPEGITLLKTAEFKKLTLFTKSKLAIKKDDINKLKNDYHINPSFHRPYKLILRAR